MEELKIENYAFDDEETKLEFQKYLDEINEYNRKVANGEKPDKDIAALASELESKFVFEGTKNNCANDNNFAELVEKLNAKIEEIDEELSKKLGVDVSNLSKEMIDKRIEELNKLEEDDN